MNDRFYRITRCITEEKGCHRLSEIRLAGYYSDTGREQITACVGKSLPWNLQPQENAAPKAA